MWDIASHFSPHFMGIQSILERNLGGDYTPIISDGYKKHLKETKKTPLDLFSWLEIMLCACALGSWKQGHAAARFQIQQRTEMVIQLRILKVIASTINRRQDWLSLQPQDLTLNKENTSIIFFSFFPVRDYWYFLLSLPALSCNWVISM